MLQIYANDQQLDTAGVKFNITLKNPMFCRDRLEGSYIFNFKIPSTNTNKTIFGFPNRIEKYSPSVVELTADVYFKGIPLAEKSTLVAKQTGNHITANIKIGSGQFNSLTSGLTLRNGIDWGGDINIGSTKEEARQYLEDSVNHSYPDRNFVVFPVSATNWHDPLINDVRTEYLNYWEDGSLYLYTTGIGTSITTPFPYLLFVLEKLFSHYGYRINKSIFSLTPELRKLVLFSVLNTNDIILPHISKGMRYINYKNIMPDISISDFLLGLQNLFNIAFIFKHSTKSVDIVSRNQVIFDTSYVDYTERTSPIPTIKNNSLSGYILKQTPDGGDEFANEQSGSIDPDLVKPAVNTFSDLPLTTNSEAGDIRLVKDENKYYQIQGNDLGAYEWAELSWAFELIEGDSDNKWESIMSTLLMEEVEDDIIIQAPEPDPPPEYYDFLTQKTWLVPKTGQTKSSYPEFTPRLLFYRGIFEGYISGENPPGSIIPDLHYPLGSSDVYDPNGDKIPSANYSLHWCGPYGLYENWWKKFISWYINTRKPVTFRRLFTAAEIRNLDFSKKHRIDGTDYLIKEIKIPVTEKEIMPATMECYSV